jgi:anaerobic selenocysteine-containing dehydrogenase
MSEFDPRADSASIVSVTDRVRPGDCFAPFHWNDVFGEYLSINAVTNDAVDPISGMPEFKVCAVQIARSAALVEFEQEAHV